jgi:hypothetical protein
LTQVAYLKNINDIIGVIMATVRIQIRRGTASDWSTTNPTLAAGEIGLETDTLKFKIGNGSSAWNSITSYANVVPTDLNNTLDGYLETGDLGVTVAELVEGNLYVPGTDIELADTHTVTISSSNATDDRTITLPNATTTLVGTDTTDTLTNKTLTSPVITGLTLNDGSVVFEGAVADSYETTVTVTEPTADRTITLPDATGTVALTSNIPSTTDGLSEGTTNKYFTDERAQDAIGNSVGNGLDYDDNTGAISVDPSEFALSAVGSPTADINMASYKITSLAAPTSANDAANKAYVDNLTAGLNFHAAAHAGTTANLDATYDNGTSGVGATLTANSNGALVVDGHTLNADERVLVKNQTTGLQNGIYVVTTTGDGSTPWVLTRATDADNSPSGEVAYGDFIFIQQGSTNAGFGYIVNTPGTITLGTTSISYVQFNAGQVVIAGSGLTEPTAGTLAVDTTLIQTRVTDVSDTEIGYLNGVTSAIQTQIDAKLDSTTAASTYAPLASPTFTGTVILPSSTVTNDMLAGSIANNKLSNSSVTINGESVSLGGSVTISAAPTPSAVSSNITMQANYNYFVDTSAARTLTLPATPALGDTIAIYDASGTAATNNITISRNGNKINGQTEDALIDVDQAASVLVYTGATIGWKFD